MRLWKKTYDIKSNFVIIDPQIQEFYNYSIKIDTNS